MIALAVRLDSPGPVFFTQTRVGRDGRRFSMVKFRTMVVDADRLLAELEDRNEADGLLFKMRVDPRVTRTGRFLRRYSIDELPQILNVLRGEMSIVGPRPPLPAEVERYEHHVSRRLLVKPGITGLWQVSGRSDLPWDEAVRLDLYYVRPLVAHDGPHDHGQDVLGGRAGGRGVLSPFRRRSRTALMAHAARPSPRLSRFHVPRPPPDRHLRHPPFAHHRLRRRGGGRGRRGGGPDQRAAHRPRHVRHVLERRARRRPRVARGDGAAVDLVPARGGGGPPGR